MVPKDCLRRAFCSVGSSLVLSFAIGIGAQASPATDACKQGKHLLEEQKYREATVALGKAIEFDPKYAAAYLVRGAAYGELRQYQNAINDFNQAIRLDPKFADAYNNRGVAYRNLERYQSGREHYKNSPERYQRAISDFNKALSLKPRSAEYYINRGDAYECLGQKEKASNDYATAISLAPENLRAFYNRGRINEMQDTKKAIDDFTTAIALNPKCWDCYDSRANVYWGLRQLQKAIDDCSKMIEIDPLRAAGYVKRGEWLYYAKAPDETALLKSSAVDDLNKAIELAPKNLDAYLYLGRVYHVLGQYQKEADNWTRAIALSPKMYVYYGQRARAYEKLGKQDLAQKDQAKVRALGYLGPGTPDITGTQTWTVSPLPFCYEPAQ